MVWGMSNYSEAGGGLMRLQSRWSKHEGGELSALPTPAHSPICANPGYTTAEPHCPPHPVLGHAIVPNTAQSSDTPMIATPVGYGMPPGSVVGIPG